MYPIQLNDSKPDKPPKPSKVTLGRTELPVALGMSLSAAALLFGSALAEASTGSVLHCARYSSDEPSPLLEIAIDPLLAVVTYRFVEEDGTVSRDGSSEWSPKSHPPYAYTPVPDQGLSSLKNWMSHTVTAWSEVRYDPRCYPYMTRACGAFEEERTERKELVLKLRNLEHLPRGGEGLGLQELSIDGKAVADTSGYICSAPDPT